MKKKPGILIIDDTELNIDILMGILKHYDVIPALSGQEALQIAMEETIDLILLDILMPGMDGFEVCKRLKANDRTKHIPVIMVSVKNMEQDIIQGYELGIVDFITKPYNPVELLEKVKIHLDLYACHLNNSTQKLSRLSAQAMTNDVLIHLHNHWKNISATQDSCSIQNFSETFKTFIDFFHHDTQTEVFTICKAVSFAESIIGASLENDGIQLQINENQPARASGVMLDYSLVIVNVLSAARDALLKRNVTKPIISIEIDIYNEKSLIVVRDNRGHMKNDEVKCLFRPMGQSTELDKIKLYLAKSIIEDKLGGEIDSHSWELGIEFLILL